MDLLQFIMCCKLAGLVRKHYRIDDWNHKLLINRDDIHLELSYSTASDEKGEIVKCHMFQGTSTYYNPHLSTMIEIFFPNELS